LSIKIRSFPYNNLGPLNVYKLNKENNSKDLNNAQNSVFKGYILFFQILEATTTDYLTPTGAGASNPKDWTPPHYGFDCTQYAYAQAKIEQA
tara:strand:- start:235 stop:510 length:276 start_codon:yes stop_codon:yes gene_type:complete